MRRRGQSGELKSQPGDGLDGAWAREQRGHDRQDGGQQQEVNCVAQWKSAGDADHPQEKKYSGQKPKRIKHVLD